jgi:hypothetical protein
VAVVRLSCHRFRANELRRWLSLIAYNLGNLWRRLTLPARIGKWSLTSLQQRLVKTGGRLIQHARYYWLLLAESHLTAAVRRHAGEDRAAAVAGGPGCSLARQISLTRSQGNGTSVRERPLKNTLSSGRDQGEAALARAQASLDSKLGGHFRLPTTGYQCEADLA